tara:strand:+ start:73 stop:288 length:216 start_codon:yes stop_codon:yes gene_type:complete
MRPLVTNMGIHKNPWDDVPVEVLIEYERKKREQLKDHREELRLPIYSPVFPENRPSEQEAEEDYKITIDFI